MYKSNQLFIPYNCRSAENYMISQYSPYSCALDCLSSYLRELNFDVHTSDILKNHRDICWNDPPHANTYGAIDIERIKRLCHRYLLVCEQITITNVSDISRIIGANECLLIYSTKFEGKDICHTVRVVGINSDECKIFSPKFPYGECILRTPDYINSSWGEVYWLHIRPIIL